MPDTELERLHFDYFVEATGYVLDDPIQRDKPDVVVTYQGMKTGIELTEGCPEEQKRATVIAKKAGLESFCSSDLRDRPKESRIANNELLDKISEPSAAKSEISDVRWANRVAQRIKGKADKLKTGEIESFEKNWLVVVDTSPNIASERTEFLRAVLMSALGADHLENPVFDLTYIVGCGNIFIIDERNTLGISRRSKN
ncbi:MAG: hypothetical protein O3C43_06485 [Verrucomicrobia bacterium]|nr:hypothetical protein [Verrucomicrobiota bacterium]MDA1066134.1 hypothetical protein [Verrucomicrobiota bacterium]